MKLIPALLGLLVLSISSCLTACSGGGGAEVSVSQTVTQNQNNNSQNGEAECRFECEPVELAGSAGFAVTQVCSGVIQNGPNFFEVAPVGCTFTAAEEKEVAQEEQAEESVGLNQEGAL